LKEKLENKQYLFNSNFPMWDFINGNSSIKVATKTAFKKSKKHVQLPFSNKTKPKKKK